MTNFPAETLFPRLALLLRAGLRLAAVAWCLRTRGFVATEHRLAARWRPQRAGRRGIATRPVDLAWAVRRAASLAPMRPACLCRSLALWSLLREEGESGALRLGARQSPTGLLAHAWVEVGGIALGEEPGVAARFPVMVPLGTDHAGSASRRQARTRGSSAKSRG